jgi:glycine hydroxymethyltransferase
MVDMAHIAGLVATGLHPNPVAYADIVTSTTHKTLRGPRGGIILCREDHKKAVNKSVFPGNQGGPLVHVVAAKAVCFKEAMTDQFRAYQNQVVGNAKALSQAVAEGGYRIVSGGTDTHLFLVDVHGKGLTGKEAEAALEEASITVNKNTIPFDQHPPLVTSGIRVGTPALTTRGMKESEMRQIGTWMTRVLDRPDSETVKASVREKVRDLAGRFPIYSEYLVEQESPAG